MVQRVRARDAFQKRTIIMTNGRFLVSHKRCFQKKLPLLKSLSRMGILYTLCKRFSLFTVGKTVYSCQKSGQVIRSGSIHEKHEKELEQHGK